MIEGGLLSFKNIFVNRKLFGFLYHGIKLVEKTRIKFTKVRIFGLVPVRHARKRYPPLTARPTPATEFKKKKFLRMLAGTKNGVFRYFRKD